MAALFQSIKSPTPGAIVFFSFCLMLSGYRSTAQTDNPEKAALTNAIIDYFAADRENIHLQPAKSVFLTSEKLWFHGYVYSRQAQNLSINTNNVYVSLHDTKGNLLDTKLVFAQNGRFAGNFAVGPEQPRGTYYLRAYTNWMSNFKEDESTVIKIYLINPDDKTIPDFKTPNPKTMEVSLHPEGGSLISGIPNVVGINIADCNGNPFMITEGELVDAEGNFIRNITTNTEGNGKFTVESLSGQKTFIKITTFGTSLLYPVPEPSPLGVSLALDNSSPDFINVAFKTNLATAAHYAGKPLTFIIQKDNLAHFFTLSFTKDQLVQEFSIQPEFLFPGVNTLRVLDPDQNQIAERLFYRHNQTAETPVISSNVINEKVVISAGNLTAGSSVNFKIFPSATKVMAHSPTITSSLLVDPYIDRPVTNPELYLIADSKKFAKSFDMMMIQQRSKYSWNNILSGPDPIKYTFDRGLTIKGKVINAPKDIKDYRIRVYSLKSGINEMVALNSNSEFILENLVLADSTSVNITLEKLADGKPVKFAGSWKVMNTVPTQPKTLTVLPNCDTLDSGEPIPFLADGPTSGEVLKTVIIKSNVKSEFKHKDKPVNLLLKAHKIKAQNNGATVLDFIADNGFDVNRQVTYKMIGVMIVGKNITTIQAMPSFPAIFVDDVKLLSNNILWHIKMEDVDEIYINPSAIVNSLDNNIGIIRIYMKHGVNSSTLKDSNAHSIDINGGFQKHEDFTPTRYTNSRDANNFGIINWNISQPVNDLGTATIELSETPTNTITVSAESVDPSGKIVSSREKIVIAL